ncbi:hypothetical protein ACS0TY_025168 [Phlomoides rotata]
MKNMMASIWRPMRGVSVKPIGDGRFLFQFFHVLDVNRVLEGSPWSFNNHPLILHPLLRGEHPFVYDLPHGFFTGRVGVQLGDFIGKFIEYDNSNRGAAWMTFMHIRVEVDTDIPLKRWKKVGQKAGCSFVVHFKYEKLNSCCFVCGILGHTENFCELRFASPEEEPKREWGLFSEGT